MPSGHGLDDERTYGLPLLIMWLRELRGKNLKRLRDFTLDLRGADGEPRKWTVIIGPSGTGKTSILQAAALAAHHAREHGPCARASARWPSQSCSIQKGRSLAASAAR